jgi:predicted deacylase
MAKTATRITSDIDFEAAGKQLSYLRLTHSDDRHAFGIIPVPIAVFANGAGPTVLVSAGNHGDEYEGQVILHALIRELDPAKVSGRLIVMPALNYPAVLAGSRVSPLDLGNFNRAFPGDPDGTPTAALAHYVESEILARCDGAADLHSGGRSGNYVPCAYLHGGGGAGLLRRKIAAAREFGAPYTVIAKGTSDSRSMSAACDRLGVVMVATELAGGGTVDRRALAIGRAGLLRLLHHFGVLAEPGPCEHRAETRLIVPLGAASSVMVPCDGLFEPACDPGDGVAAGDLAGRVWPIGELDQPGRALSFAQAGVVSVRRVGALVRRGDYVARLARETSEAELLG